MMLIMYQIQNRKRNIYEFAFTPKDKMTPKVRSMDGFISGSKGILLSEEK